MTFVTAWLAAAGAAAMAIPILIHLLSRQRRKPIEWAAMRFLLEAIRKHKRRLQLQQILLLATRCLVVLLLGAALARPILSQAGLLAQGGNRAVYLVIDNSMASGLAPDRTAALQAHINHAREIISALDPGDRVGVITTARPAHALLSPPSSDHASVLSLLQTLTPADAPADVAGAMIALRQALDQTADDRDHTFVYLLSEFRAGSAPLDSPLPTVLRDLGPRVTLLHAPPAAATVGNVQIVAIEPVRSVVVPGAADGSGQITVRLARHGDELAADVSRVRVVVEAPGSVGPALPEVEPRLVRWEPGQSQASVDVLLSVAAMNDQELSITARLDDDSLNADNARHVVLSLRRQIRVAMLERRAFGFESTIDRFRAGQWIRRALEPREGGPMQLIEVEPAALSPADVRTADVVVAARPDLLNETGWRVLREFVDAGGLLIVTPPGDLNVHQWAERFTAELDLPWRIALEAVDHTEGMFLADEQPASELLRLISTDIDELSRSIVVMRSLTVDVAEQSGSATALRLADGSPALLVGAPPDARGMVAFFTPALELSWTSLPSKPLMVPLMHELVRQGLSLIHASQQIIAGDQPVIAGYAGGRAATEVVDPAGQRVPLDGRRGGARPIQPLSRAGLYELRDGGSNALGTFAVNIAPEAGRTETQLPAAVAAWLGASGPWSVFSPGEAAAGLKSTPTSSPLAAILLLTVLALLAIETILARWFSYSSETAEVKLVAASSRPVAAAGGQA